ncbi:MAG TPA: hypothetical protein VLS89_14080 [Candidatus Nanopelagicales bacterium]|nr:hypothetical protein [Candidatus Nanopelagicales bacterium]
MSTPIPPSAPSHPPRRPPRRPPRAPPAFAARRRSAPERPPLHAILVDLLGTHPEALAYLLSLRGDAPAAPLIPASETEVKVIALERRLDRVFLLGRPEAPEGFVLTEVQLRRDRAKRFAWPLYVELARSRYGCEGALVVLTVDPAVRGWIARRIARASRMLGTTRRLSPTVLALDTIEPELLLRPDRPYLAPLAVIAQVRTQYVEPVAREALRITMDHLPDRLAAAQLDAILGVLDRAMRARLERTMMEHPRFYSETFRRLYAKATGEGRAEGITKGRAEGRAKGRAEGQAKAILAVLAARGIPVSDAIRARILRCTDLARLRVWIRRAAVESSASAVVRPSRRKAGGEGARARSARSKPRR